LQFEAHHRAGRTSLTNIHDPSNLVALCNLCHTAFDNFEWTFFPDDMNALIAEAEAGGNFAEAINDRREIRFRRWRLITSSDFEASNDPHFLSAFTNEPTKVWTGEIGAVIIRNPPALESPQVETETADALEQYFRLHHIWRVYNHPCSQENCPLCRPKEKPDNLGEGEDQDGEKNQEDDENEQGPSRKKRRMAPPKPRKYETRQSVAATRTHNSSMPKKDIWEQSAPYDTSVPFSHRKGYTFYNTTANELIDMMCGLPYLKHKNGKITLLDS
jgi:HNH endonuclease